MNDFQNFHVNKSFLILVDSFCDNIFIYYLWKVHGAFLFTWYEVWTNKETEIRSLTFATILSFSPPFFLSFLFFYDWYSNNLDYIHAWKITINSQKNKETIVTSFYCFTNGKANIMEFILSRLSFYHSHVLWI